MFSIFLSSVFFSSEAMLLIIFSLFLLLPSEEDKNFRPKLFENEALQSLVNNKYLKEYFKNPGRIEPPYIVDGEAPPLSQWERRDAISVDTVKVGDVLQGVAGSPGVITGTARIMLDLSDPMKLEPGDIMIAPSTDPSWTPLFLAAGAVITNIGAVGTHAVQQGHDLADRSRPRQP